MLETPRHTEQVGLLWFVLIVAAIQTIAAVVGVVFDVLGYFAAVRN